MRAPARWLVPALSLVFSPVGHADPVPTLNLDGLHRPATVIRDEFGIAHIRARDSHDVYFLQGWVHARDRLFQMDVLRRQASGRLAELLGPDALATDVQTRTLGLHRAAERSLPLLDEQARDVVRAYVEGINAGIRSQPLPPEYHALELSRVAPWTELDVMAVTKLILFGVSFDDQDIANTEALLAAMAALGPTAGQALYFEDLWRAESFDHAATVPDAGAAHGELAAPRRSGRTRTHHVDPDALHKAGAFFTRLRKDKHLGWAFDDQPKGSNQWAVAGRHTRNGRPLLANDPHLALGTPTTFYPIHLRGPGLDVIGNGFAGVPAVITGHNRHIAWGATVNPMDVTDFYNETLIQDSASPSGLSTRYLGRLEPVIPIPEQFRYNQPGNGVSDDLALADPTIHGVPTATLIVPRRNQGPLIAVQTTAEGLRGISLQYTGFSGTRELQTFLAWNRARNLDDFRAGLTYFDVGGQNWAYADRDGNIAYFTSSEMPLREDLQAMTVNGLPPFFVRNGEGGNEWLPVTTPQSGQAIPYEILPVEEMPHLVNPPACWFINANNDPAGLTLDNDPLNQLRPGGGIFYLHNSYDSLRAGRLTQLLRGKLSNQGKVGFADMQAMQADVTLLDAQILTPYLLAALDHGRDASAHPDLAALASDPEIIEAIERLRNWRFDTPTGIAAGYDASDSHGELSEPGAEEIDASVAATLYTLWRSRVVQNTLDEALDGIGIDDFRPQDPQSIAALRHLLDDFDTAHGYGRSGVNFFAGGGTGDPVSDRDVILLRSLKQAIDLAASDALAPAFAGTRSQDDLRWGLLHRVTFSHVLGAPFSTPPAGGALPAPLSGLAGIPTDGGFGTPDAAFHALRVTGLSDLQFRSGPVTRFAAGFTHAGPVAHASLPGGTSGVLGDPNYANLLPDWLTNDSFPLARSPGQLRRHTATTTRLLPVR